MTREDRLEWWLQRWYGRRYGTVARDAEEWGRVAFRGVAVWIADHRFLVRTLSAREPVERTS